MRRRHALAGLLVGGALSLVASLRPWWRVVGRGTPGESPVSAADATFSGNASTAGLAQSLSLVALAAGLVLLTLGRRGRRVLAVVVTVVGVAMTAVGLVRSKPSDELVRATVRTFSLDDTYALAGTVWSWVYVLAGVSVAGAGLITLIWSGRWPGRERRFAPQASASRSGDETDLWKALDRGDDPTLSTPPTLGGAANGPDQDPEVHTEGSNRHNG